jgi:hypothetical protein
MAASCCTCVAWGIVPPRTSVVVLALRVWDHVPVGAGLVMRGGDLSCEAGTYRARWRLVVGVPLVGNRSEMQATDRRLDVLPLWVLTRVFPPPCPESLP